MSAKQTVLSAGSASLGIPRTEAVRRALRLTRDTTTAADLLFLEAWETCPPADIAATLRASQIRRANRSLAAEIRAELDRGRPLSEIERASIVGRARRLVPS